MIVSTENLTHRYGDRTALCDLTFSVREGEIFGILGPNGGGKSTLFRILSTMMAPTSGRASVAGCDLEREPEKVRRAIGVVFQTQSLDKKLTVEENLHSQGRLYGLSGEELRRRAGKAMDRLGLTSRRGDLVQTLSGGLKRRVEIAKALLHHPAVLLMDEPSTGLDPGARRELWGYIDELRNERGITVLLTTHILDEADRCDRLLLLHEGRAVAEGTPEELKGRIGGDVVVFESDDLAGLERQLGVKLGVNGTVANGGVRVEIANGHRFITEAVEALPGVIRSVALHKPTLEDVFLDLTGVTIE